MLKEALQRLHEQRNIEHNKPHKLGTQISDAELIWAHIKDLECALSMALDYNHLKGNLKS